MGKEKLKADNEGKSGCLSHYFEFIIIVIIIIIIILFDLISLLFFSIFHIYSCGKHFLSSFILGSKPIGQTRFRGKGILNVLRSFLFPKPESFGDISMLRDTMPKCYY